MKIKKEDFETLKSMIVPIFDRVPVSTYKSENPAFSDKRIRWDYYHAAGREAREFVCYVLYKYLNDDHIDTALKAIVGI